MKLLNASFALTIFYFFFQLASFYSFTGYAIYIPTKSVRFHPQSLAFIIITHLVHMCVCICA